jgi:3-hydroxyacyl-[acyl-carrier-protein] dehydratase
MRFLLVDRILELEPLKRIVATKYVRPDEDYFPDHFPGYPVMPGVLQIESMAQAAGKCLMAGIESSRWPVLIQVKQANFRKQVLPDSTLRIEADITTCNAHTATAQAKISCDDQTVADATVVFGFIQKGALTPGFEDEVLLEFKNRGAGKHESV